MVMVRALSPPGGNASSSERESFPLAVFLLLGKTGSGKSTFIKLLGGTDLYTGNEPEVDAGINSATKKIAPFNCNIDGRRVILIDTPGFDDSAADNIEILNDIVSHLLYLYRKRDRYQLHGVVFLHDISEVRYSGSQKKTMSILRQICGNRAMGNVIIGTTMWDTGSNTRKFAEQERREVNILREHWSGIHSTVRLLEDNFQAAEGIITTLLSVTPVTLLVQDEILQTGVVGETTVGKTIFKEGTDELERERLRGDSKEVEFLVEMLSLLKTTPDMTLMERFALALAVPVLAVIVAPVAAYMYSKRFLESRLHVSK